VAPRTLAEWDADRERYSDAISVQALAGTSPVAYESKNYSKPHKRYSCLKPLRNALQQFVRATTKQEAWALAYYQRKRKEGKSRSMALRALANVWVCILYAMWLKHTRSSCRLSRVLCQRSTK
jgi:transposase IS116/IS110/IS902 family protein